MKQQNAQQFRSAVAGAAENADPNLIRSHDLFAASNSRWILTLFLLRYSRFIIQRAGFTKNALCRVRLSGYRVCVHCTRRQRPAYIFLHRRRLSGRRVSSITTPASLGSFLQHRKKGIDALEQLRAIPPRISSRNPKLLLDIVLAHLGIRD